MERPIRKIDYVVSDPRAARARIILGLLLDKSGSMETETGDGKTRYMLLIETLLNCLEEMMNDELFASDIYLTLTVFDETSITLYQNVCLSKLRLEDIAAKFKDKSLKPGGMTDLDGAIVNIVTILDQEKERLRKEHYSYEQPICVLLTDGEPNYGDAMMKNSVELVQKEQSEGDLVFIPVGIGVEGTRFPTLERLLDRSIGSEAAVLKSSDDFTKFFRIIPDTVRATANSFDPKKIVQQSYSKLAK